MLRKIFILSILSISLSFSTVASARKVIKNHQKTMHEKIELEIAVVNGIKVYYSKDQEYRLARVDKTTRDLQLILPVDPDKSCRDIELNIFLIPSRILNDRGIMHFISWGTLGTSDLWGAYDSFHKIDIGEMYVNTDSTDTRLSSTIAHEWFHHHQTSNCNKRSEEGVNSFERRFCEISTMC